MFKARSNPLVAQVSEREIVILGGSFKRYLSDGYIFNADFNTVKQVLQMPDDCKFETSSNQCAMIDNGKVAGIICNQQYHAQLVTYQLGESKLKVVEEIGQFIWGYQAPLN